MGELKSQFDNSKAEIATLKTENVGIVTKNQEQQTQIETLETKTLETKTDLEKFKNQILAEINQIRQFSDYSSETQSQNSQNSNQISSQNSSQNSQ